MDSTAQRPPSRADDARSARVTLLAGLVLLGGTIFILTLAPGSYEILLTFHVIAAVIWVGGGVALSVLALAAERRRDDEALIAIGKQAEWIGLRVFVPASFVVLGFGIALVAEGPWEWSSFWVLAGLIGWSVSALVGMLFLGPESGRLAKLATERGFDDPETRARLKRILTVARFDVILLVLITLDMAAKPFL